MAVGKRSSDFGRLMEDLVIEHGKMLIMFKEQFRR